MRQQGIGFLGGTTWDPNTGQFGILPEIWGTLYTSWLALVIGSAFGIAAAIFLSEGFLSQGIFGFLKTSGRVSPVLRKLPDQVEAFLKNLDRVPCGNTERRLRSLGALRRDPYDSPGCNWINLKLGWIPFFGTTLTGPGLLPAVIVLSIMVLPTITAISRGALVSVPSKLRMAAYGMGDPLGDDTGGHPAHRGRGIVAAVVLAFGRALGETMALAMLVGNANRISFSLFSPANTLAALLANNFPEAAKKDVPY